MKSPNNFIKKNLSLFILFPLFLKKSFLFFIDPRIWAEEGSIYFTSAVKYGALSIFKLQQGYFSIIPNFTLYLASLVDYKFVPLFTFAISFIFWILPFWLINNINSDELKDDDLTKFLMGISLFVLLNNYQEIFLNTINLQFITPIILFIVLLYDFKKLSLIKQILFYILIIICLTNGVLSFPLVPFLIYKMISEKKYEIALAFSIAFIIPILSIFDNATSNSSSISNRFLLNLNYKIEVFKKHDLIDLLNNNYYWILLFISLRFLYLKKYALSYFLAAALALFVFVDFAKLLHPDDISVIPARYKALLFSFLTIIFFVFVKRPILKYLTALVLVIVFGRNFFKHDFSHNQNAKKWSQEYKNLYQKKSAEIHPVGWKIKLK